MRCQLQGSAAQAQCPPTRERHSKPVEPDLSLIHRFRARRKQRRQDLAQGGRRHRLTLKTFRKANATLIARNMGVEAAAYQAGHSKVSMIQQH